MDDDPNTRAARAKRGSPFLNTAQAAFYIGLAKSTLELMRQQGGGPRYRRHGRFIRYHIDDLEHWSLTNRDPASRSGRDD
ncbi:helix-turn-helix transcriptional regulator [Sphingomonas sp. 2378]|uniref:helix-turn-helix transcriptional regulator n=1 Tax=Sphingomonas sp. 2378 TaxID=1219748 RepID=UPI00311ABE4C